MSKKYVIELEDAPYRKANGMSEPLYRVKGFNSLVFDQNGLDKLEKFDFDYIKSHLDFGVLQESAYRKGYEDGFEDGLKAKENQIRVGDEVQSMDSVGKDIMKPWVVMSVNKELAYGFGFDADTSSHCQDFKHLRKTGRHFDAVEKLLEEMKT